MKRLFVVLAIVFMASVAWSAPFLVCDVDENTTSYLVVMNDGAVVETPAPLHLDLATIPNGNYAVTVRAKNFWGVSPSVPFEFTKALPVIANGVGLSSE